MTGWHQAKLGTRITAEGQEYLEKDFQTRIARVHRKRRRFASATGRARRGWQAAGNPGPRDKVAVQRNSHFAFQRREDRDALLEIRLVN
jgi:hypothetical protein